MKNIQFYYNEIKEINKVENLYNFVIRKDMDITLETSCLQDVITWLNEEHQFLTKEEREYLSNVIKPFRNRIKLICKHQIDCENFEQYLDFLIEYPNGKTKTQMFALPYFEKDSMYKGMDLFNPYTLEDLGL